MTLFGWKGNRGLAESNGSLPPGGWLKITCGLTACTPGSAPGPTLGNEYGKTFPFLLLIWLIVDVCQAIQTAVRRRPASMEPRASTDCLTIAVAVRTDTTAATASQVPSLTLCITILAVFTVG